MKKLLFCFVVLAGVFIASGASAAVMCPNPALVQDLQRGDTDGATGGQVSSLQAFLWQYRDIYGWNLIELTRDQFVVGNFGRKTQDAVKAFQTQFGVVAAGAPGWGRVGPLTRTAILAQCSGSSPAPLSTNTMTIQNGGFSVSLDSLSPALQWVAAGSVGVTMNVLQFVATSEDMALTDLRLQGGSTKGDAVGRHIASISLWDGATLLTQRSAPAFINNVEDFSFPISGAGSFVIPANSSKRMTVKIDVANVCMSCSGSAGAPIYVDFDGDGTALGKNKAVGRTSAVSVNASTAVDTYSQGINYFRSVPTFTQVPLVNFKLTSGTQVLNRFSIRAHQSGDIALRKFTFKVATSGITAMAITPPSFQLYNVTENKFVNVATASAALYFSSPKNYDSANNLIVRIYPENAGYAMGEVKIPAGQTYTFELRGSVVTDGYGDAIATQLLGETYVPAGIGMYTANFFEGYNDSRTVWSDLSADIFANHSLASSDWMNGYRVPGLLPTGLPMQVLSDGGSGGSGSDITPPVVTILVPTSASATTTAKSAIGLSATVTDNVSTGTNFTVTWSNSLTGQTGVVTPTIYGWGAFNIPLNIGTNVITYTARDQAGNAGIDTLTVTRTQNSGTGLTVSSGTQPQATLAPQGAISLPFTRVRFTAGSGDVTINSLTIEKAGLMNDAALKGVILLDENGARLGSAKSLNINHQAVLDASFIVRANQTREMTIAGDMASSLNLYAGQVGFLQLIAVNTLATVNGTLPIIGTGHTVNSSLMIGTLTLANAPSVPAQNITAGATNQILGGFDVTVANEPIVAPQMTFYFSSNGSAVTDFTNIMLVDSMGRIVAGPKDISGTSVSFTDPVTFPVGKNTYSIKGNVAARVSGGTVFQARTNPARDWTGVKGQTFGYSIVPSPDFSVPANPMTVKNGSLNVSVNSTVPAKTISTGATAVSLVSYTFDATRSSEDVRVTSIPLKYSHTGSPSDIMNCQLYVNSLPITTGSNSINPSSTHISGGDITFTPDVPGFTVRMGTTVDATLRCNIASGAVGGTTYNWGLQTPFWGVGAATGNAVQVSIVPSVGPTMTITSGGGDITPPVVTILVPTSASATTTAKSAIALSATVTDNVSTGTNFTVTWSNSLTGQTGSVTPTIYGWAAFNIPLNIGTNVITYTARDQAGNTGTDTLTVTRTNPGGVGSVSQEREQALANILYTLKTILAELRSMGATP